MPENWYYVHKGNRLGPVATEVIKGLIAREELKSEDFVWRKGFDAWKKVKEVEELAANSPLIPAMEPELPPVMEPPKAKQQDLRLSQLDPQARQIYVRVVDERQGVSNDYGPFNLSQLIRLHKEKRINGKSFVYVADFKDWKLLADLPDYQEVFSELPPVIKETDRRASSRKPFIARLFIQNNKKLFEGICRDISVGGMQVLIDHFNGSVGDKISINVHPENSDYHFVASGQVVRILEGGGGFSFRFQGLSEEAKKSIEKYLQEN